MLLYRNRYTLHNRCSRYNVIRDAETRCVFDTHEQTDRVRRRLRRVLSRYNLYTDNKII